MKQFSKEEIKKLKRYWKQLKLLEDDFYFGIQLLEKNMQRNLKIKDLEFIIGCDGSYCGIGNTSKTIKLLHDDKLEKNNG